VVPRARLFTTEKTLPRIYGGETLSDTSFWTKMREIGIVAEGPRKSIEGESVRCVEVAPFDEARSKFAAYMAEGEAMWDHAVAHPPYYCETCEEAAQKKAAAEEMNSL